MDELWNCLTLACCPPAEAEVRLAAYIAKECGDNYGPKEVAQLMLKTFDFAEKGTLQPLVQSIARLARG